MDALRAREASELRLSVAEMGLDADGAGAAGDLLRRDAGEHEGLRDHGQALQGLVRAVPRERAGGVLQLDQVLEDTCCRLRQRPEELHGLQQVAAGLAAIEG